MAQGHDDDADGMSRRGALARLAWSAGMLGAATGLPERWRLFGPARAAAPAPTIPVIVKDMARPYWQAVLAGARKAGDELGAQILALGGHTEADADGEVAALSNALAAKPAALVIAPAPSAALAKAIEEAARGVKIIAVDSGADAKALTALVATDNVQAGRMAADALATAIKRSYADAEGDVAIISAAPGVAALAERAKGFTDQLAASYGAIAIVAQPVADGPAASGAKIMAELIAAHSELRGVVALDLAMTQGAAQVLAKTPNNTTGDKINLVGFDADEGVVEFLKNGVVAALVVQDPFRMGYDGVKAALAAARGEEVPPRIATAGTLVTKANMNSARAQELLAPKLR
ncbi:MAG TPA: substrate-binding domain-containing protein [Xanthobacteraceae bacterium]|jgi:ribose transport system substrate-binding protein|nr:substrate-binding domain-containing protein [Xanthobacteraceae bacterium]